MSWVMCIRSTALYNIVVQDKKWFCGDRMVQVLVKDAGDNGIWYTVYGLWVNLSWSGGVTCMVRLTLFDTNTEYLESPYHLARVAKQRLHR
jgi:hypothetical protein